MKQQFQLAALDLDGTLFNSQGQISDITKSAIIKATAAGVTFVISTGRPYQGLPLEAMKELHIHYAITTNGASIYAVPERKCLDETCMPYEQTAQLLEKLLTLELHIDLFIKGKSYTPSVCRKAIESMDHLPPSLKEYIWSTRSFFPNLPALLREKKVDVQKIAMNFLLDENGSPLNQREVIEILKDYPDICYLSGGFGNLEFTKKGVSKAHGLSFLCNYLSIPQNETIACGDSENDIDMLQAAQLGVAMLNAPEHVKSQADEITLSNDEDGVAAMIEKWLL
ncbi:MAG: Cof-type HAD-IIB family hydrolase [Lachnospiraceae bacterium]